MTLLLASGCNVKVRNISRLRAIEVAQQASLLLSIDTSASSKEYAPKAKAWHEIAAALQAADRASRDSADEDEPPRRVRCWWPCGCTQRDAVLRMTEPSPSPFVAPRREEAGTAGNWM